MNNTRILQAVNDGDCTLMARFLKNGGNPNAVLGPKMTLPEAAVEAGAVDILRLLLDAGADIRTRIRGGRRLLERAFKKGTPRAADIVRLLLERGAKCTDEPAAAPPLPPMSWEAVGADDERYRALVQTVMDCAEYPEHLAAALRCTDLSTLRPEMALSLLYDIRESFPYAFLAQADLIDALVAHGLQISPKLARHTAAAYLPSVNFYGLRSLMPYVGHPDLILFRDKPALHVLLNAVLPSSISDTLGWMRLLLESIKLFLDSGADPRHVTLTPEDNTSFNRGLHWAVFVMECNGTCYIATPDDEAVYGLLLAIHESRSSNNPVESYLASEVLEGLTPANWRSTLRPYGRKIPDIVAAMD